MERPHVRRANAFLFPDQSAAQNFGLLNVHVGLKPKGVKISLKTCVTTTATD